MHPFRVEVIQAARFGVTVTADDNVLEHVKALKEGTVLKIALAEGKNYRLKAGSLKATVGMPALARVGLSHGARGTIRGFKSDRGFTAHASHGSTLEGEIEAGDIAFEASHGSEIRLKGKAKDGRLVVVHGSKLSLTDLVLRTVEIDAEHGSISRFDSNTKESVKIRSSHGSLVSGSVEAGDVTVEAEHGAKVILKGRRRRADLEASHGSLLGLAGLALEGAKAELEHSSSAIVNVKDTLDYQLENNSNLKYVGKPKLEAASSSHASTARSITADEAEKENPAILEEPSKPAPLIEEDIFISTVVGSTGVNRIGDRQAASIIGSGVSAKKVWELADFTSVQIGSTFHADITKGDKFSVTTSSDDNVVDHLRVVKEGKTLNVGLEQGWSFQLKEPLKAEILLPALDGLDAGGASKVALNGFRSEKDFKLKLHGASKVEGSIEIGDAEFDVSGASRLTLTGLAKAGRLSVSGASQLMLAEFPIKQCEIELSGASHARLEVQSGRSFKAAASGTSTWRDRWTLPMPRSNSAARASRNSGGKPIRPFWKRTERVISNWLHWSSGKPTSSCRAPLGRPSTRESVLHIIFHQYHDSTTPETPRL